MREGNLAALFVLVFPAVGAGLLVWAVRSTLRFRKYGISRLDLTTRPGVVGRSLTGTVQTTVPLVPPDGFQVTLTCVRQVTTVAGKSRSTSETILWQEERRIPGQASRDHRGLGTTIPLAFAIPRDARPCENGDPSDRVVWRLKVEAEVPGVDYESTFEVPVFRTEQSEQAPSAEELAAVADPSLAPVAFRQPPESRIRVISNRRGIEILFPAARNLGAAIGLTCFLAIWVGAIWAMLAFDAPLFPVIFGLFGLLLLRGGEDRNAGGQQAPL
ncbi:MAG: hypothetical protein H0T44_01570 [Gemmatimonadales bacterium]|nr:hypothetical protein [Gemmatimonadales bacterium]